MSYLCARDEEVASGNHRPAGRATACARGSGWKSGIIQACGEQDPERAEFVKIFAKSHYANYSDLLGDPEVDAVVICLPNFLHFRPL
jgi:predicted dehydrogenase